jgi:hypothetical protein
MNTSPYLSVVTSTRNDDHGGDPLYRTQLFVDGLLAQCDRHRVPAELVIVEWNPPADRPRMADVITWPASEWCDVRIIAVPHEVHARHEHADRLPLFQMIAKNVGIRRARGEFVLATNIDILFSDELMAWIARRRLRHGRMYRVDRWDVPAEIEPAWDMDRQLEFCRRAAIRVNRREGTLELRGGQYFSIYLTHSLRAWLRNSPRGRRVADSRIGRLLHLGQLAAWRVDPDSALGRFANSATVATVRYSRPVRAALTSVHMARFVTWRIYSFAYWIVAGFNDPRQIPVRLRRLRRRITAALGADDAASGLAADDGRSPAGGASLLARLPPALWSGARRKVASLRHLWQLEKARIRLHTNASGDFTLLARDDWERTGGYAEFEMYSMHIDGLLLYAGHWVGLREQYLPFPTYHIEHGGGFRPEVEGSDALYTILETRSIPKTSDDELMEYIRRMYTTRRPIEFNRPDWGLANELFPEEYPLEQAAEVNA